tara:strand:- start:2423 stop:3607 length:1185 start_codon:yes stop_codon:yes gene_type:complete
MLMVEMPEKNNERWKYTNLNVFDQQSFAARKITNTIDKPTVEAHRLVDSECYLLVFVDGCFVSGLSDIDKLPSDIVISSMLDALKNHEQLVNEHINRDICATKYPFAASNVTSAKDGLFLSVPDNVVLTAPLHILSLATGDKGDMASTQNLILMGSHSEAIILQEYASTSDEIYFTNAVTTIATGTASKLTIVKCQHEGRQAAHMENTFIQPGQESEVSMTQVATGAKFSRDDIVVTMHEPGAIFNTQGFYHACRDGQYIDHHIDVEHVAPHTNSEMIYKGIADKKSRAVFNGSLYVEQNAQKINAVQENHNLLLSNLAEVYSKPELEIYADDVKCRHGATTGQIDQDAMFYMRSRGIDEASAKSILLKGFAEEVVQRISHPSIQRHAMKQVNF